MNGKHDNQNSNSIDSGSKRSFNNMITNNNNNSDNNTSSVDPSINVEELPDSKKQLTEDAIDPTQQQEQQPQLMEIDVETNQIINENGFENHGVASPEVIDMTGDDDYDVDNHNNNNHNHHNNITIEDDDDNVVDDGDDEEDDDDDDDDDDDEIQIINSEPNSNVVAPKKFTRNFPLANDFNALAAKLMKPIEDYPTKEETYYVWEIKDWAQLLKEEKVRSPKFKCGGFEWNILLFPRGNSQNNSLSIYMEPHPPVDENDKPLDENWYVCAQFGLDIWNPAHPDAHLPNQSHHRFTKNETDWGFSSLIELRQLEQVNNPRNQSSMYAILENNKLNITGFVRVIDDSSTGVLWHSFLDYDSKANTGYVGLNNQGATCYLNSLLQSYFTTKLFRKLVYEIPTDLKSAGVPLSLQRIFYLLTNSNDPVGTLELTKSFGWDSSDAFTQHDVQELNRILMDKLETAMKGSKIEGALNDIFVGKMKSYIKCVNVPYESSRVEDFWDIQLNVKGFQTLKQSFQNYIEIEMLEGENKYQAGEEHGYQDAKKGVVFESFPPVLHLQLKRFEYDFMVDDLVKIDDFYEFPDKIDLKPYLDEDLPEDVKNQNWNYKLHGVLVHQGSISNGHYYAMIKPNANDDTWLRFDDDKVWKVNKTQVFQENFGATDLTQEQSQQMTRAEQQEHMVRRVTSAYMLVYYRESELDKILPSDDNIVNSAIPEHIPKQIQFEIEEREKLEKARQEALYYITAKLITSSTFNANLGFDLALDPTNNKFYDESLSGSACDPISLKVRKDSTFTQLVEAVGKTIKCTNEKLFRLVAVCHRNNHTNRLDAPIGEEFQKSTISNVYSKIFNRKYDEMVFYVEELNKDIKNVVQLVKNKDNGYIEPKDFTFEQVFSKIDAVGTDIHPNIEFKNTEEYSNYVTIVIKYFDPVSQEIRGLSHITVAKEDKIDSIIDPIRELLGFKKNIALELYEELSQSKVEKIDSKLTFEKHELNTGDIITVQIVNPGEINKNGKFKDLKDYYKFLLTRLHVNVRPFKAEIDEEDSDFIAHEDDEDEDEENKGGETNNGTGYGGKGNGKDTEKDNKATNDEIQLAKNLSKSFDFWISTNYSYQDLARDIAVKLNCDPLYLKIFILTAQGQRFPLKTSHHLSQLFPKTVSVNQIVEIEYEILNIPLKDYENLKAIKIHWLTTLLQYQVFEVLVPKRGTIGDVITKVLHKVNVSESDLPHLFVWSGRNHKFHEMLKFDRALSTISDDVDLFCGIFPAEVEVLCDHDMYKRFTDKEIDETKLEESIHEEYLESIRWSKKLNLLPAFHFHKNNNYHHGIPFIFIVFPAETLNDTKERLRKKLRLGKQAFDKVRLALADNNNRIKYLEDDSLVLFDEVAIKLYSLAIDNVDRNPKRQALFEKGISIK